MTKVFCDYCEKEVGTRGIIDETGFKVANANISITVLSNKIQGLRNEPAHLCIDCICKLLTTAKVVDFGGLCVDEQEYDRRGQGH